MSIIVIMATAEDTVDLIVEKARFKDECVHRALRLKTVLDAL
ncbi:hypothetical protein [Microbulbifer sp. TYP-18]